MNIFGVGEVELVLIILIALIIAGPKRMIQWMYVLGRWVARLRGMWTEAVGMIQSEINEAGLDIEVPKELPTRGNLRKMTYNALKPLSDPVKDAVNEVRSVGTEIEKTVQQTRSTVRGLGDDVQQTGSQLTAPADTPANTSAGAPAAGRTTNGRTQPSADEKPSDGPFGTWSSRKE